MKNIFDFTGKVAVIIGASSGIGKATAVQFAENGAKVAIFARRMEKLEKVAEEIENNGGVVLPVECDATNEASVKDAIEKVEKEFGRIDILFNNAGVAVRGSVEELTEEEWDLSMNTNVKSAFLSSKYVVPIMKKQKYGKIINTASINAVLYDRVPELLRHSYNTSKAALLGLTRAMAANYMIDGITVNAIGPGLFETEMTKETLFAHEGFMKAYNMQNPAGRPGKLEEVVGTVMYLASDASNYVTGTFILVDGGLTLV